MPEERAGDQVLPDTARQITRQIPLRGYRFTRSDIKELLQIVEDQNAKARHLIVENLNQPISQETLEELDKLFVLTVMLTNIDDERATGHGSEIIDTQWHTRTKQIFASTSTEWRKIIKNEPRNRIEITIDFTKPIVFDFVNPVSQGTPNLSSLVIDGIDDAWVRSSHDKIHRFLQGRKNNRGWFHAPNVYDLFLAVIGLPFTLWGLWRTTPLISNMIPTDQYLLLNIFVHIYLGAIFLNIYRLAFQYTRWLFPVVELEKSNDASQGQRNFWWLVIVAAIGGLILDLVRAAI